MLINKVCIALAVFHNLLLEVAGVSMIGYAYLTAICYCHDDD